MLPSCWVTARGQGRISHLHISDPSQGSPGSTCIVLRALGGALSIPEGDGAYAGEIKEEQMRKLAVGNWRGKMQMLGGMGGEEEGCILI